MDRARLVPTLQALLAAALFGASAPLAKLLLGEIEPIPLAALLYLGSGIGLSALRIGSKLAKCSAPPEASITGRDWLWVIGAVAAGGVVAPIVMLFSLAATPAATASLLLNFEGVATTLIAAVVFREAVGRRIWVSVACVTVASIGLSWNTDGQFGFAPGALGIIAACALWGIDNNLTRNVSGKDPLMIVLAKGLGAGGFSLALALILGNKLPPLSTLALTLLLGFFSYGFSAVLFVRALRGLGAARTSALFAAAPFVGVIVAFGVFQQLPGWLFFAALPLMILGAALLVTEGHDHWHVHLPEDHAHRSELDQHHAGLLETASNSSGHAHTRLEHSHPHVPDIHHRHDHADRV